MHHLLGGLVRDILCQSKNFEQHTFFLLISPPNGLFKRKKKLDQNFEGGGHTELTSSNIGGNGRFCPFWVRERLQRKRLQIKALDTYIIKRVSNLEYFGILLGSVGPTWPI